MDQLRRNESKEMSLLRSDSKRASLMNLNKEPGSTFLSNYLDKMTQDEKGFLTVDVEDQPKSSKLHLPAISERFMSKPS